MAVKKKQEREAVQEWVIALRQSLGGISQQELAFRMGKAVRTVTRWETARPPTGLSLFELYLFARDTKQRAAANFFRTQFLEELQSGGLPDLEANAYVGHLESLNFEKAFGDAAVHIHRYCTNTDALWEIYIKLRDLLIDGEREMLRATESGETHSTNASDPGDLENVRRALRALELEKRRGDRNEALRSQRDR